MFISRFNVQLLYLPGLKNVVADFLFCPLSKSTGTVAATAVADPVDFEEMAAKQNRCAETQLLLGGTSLKLAFARQALNAWLVTFPLAFSAQLFPSGSKKIFFAHFHNVAHLGRLASHRIISSRFVWCRLSSDITAGTREYLACQRGKIHRHTRLAPYPTPVPQ